MKNFFLTTVDYVRKISFNERLYLAAEKIKPGFYIQIVFEGERIVNSIKNENEEIFEKELHDAVTKVAQYNPGSCLLTTGRLSWKHWSSHGPLPRIRNMGYWLDPNSPPADLNLPLCPYKGPTCEIVYSLKPKPRLVFRCFHGVMDAAGLLHFAEEIFRALRGESLIGINSTVNDTEFLKTNVGSIRRRSLNAICPPLGNSVLKKNKNVHYQKLTIDGSGVGVVAKIAAAITRFANKDTSTKTRIMIPVDIRNYDKSIRSTANLSYPLFLDTLPHQNWQELHKLILTKLINKEALRLDPMENLGVYLPLWLLKNLLWMSIRWQQMKKQYFFSALVAHASLNNPKLLAFGDYKFHSFYFLPQQSELIPLCIAVASVANKMEIVISAPNYVMDSNSLFELAKIIRTALINTE